jgi:tetratricopeptide (TPR) repeat protein
MAAALAVSLLQAQPDFQAEGLKALESQRYSEAVDLFTKAVAAEPSDFAAHFHLALALSLTGKDAEAISEYRKTLELKPGLYEAQLNLGILLMRGKQPKEAIPLLEAAVQTKRSVFRPVFTLASAQFEAGDFAAAERGFESAIKLDPKAADAHLGLGRSIFRQGRLKEATPHLRRAAELDAAHRDALLELATVHEERKELTEAIALYREFPDNIAARERLGNLLLLSDQPGEAIPHLEAVVAKAPTLAARYALATAYLRDKQPDKALPVLEQAVAGEPSNIDLRLAYGRLLRDVRRLPDAAREFYGVVKQKPDHREAWSELAAMLVSLESYPQALAALDRVEALGAATAGHVYLRAIVLDRLKQQKLALEAYRRFLGMSVNEHPDEEFKARQRARILEKELSRK